MSDWTPHSGSSDTGPGDEKSPGQQSAPEADPAAAKGVADLPKQLSELLEHLSHYLTATFDRWHLQGLRRLWRLELEVVLTLAGAGAITLGVTLLFFGIAGGLGELFGRRWLGDVGAGLLLLIGTSVAMFVWTSRREKASHQRTREKYEQRKLRQREKFGRSVADQAAAGRDERE